MDAQTDIPNFSPFYRALPPVGAAAQKGQRHPYMILRLTTKNFRSFTHGHMEAQERIDHDNYLQKGLA